jgi:hypothetical protein
LQRACADSDTRIAIAAICSDALLAGAAQSGPEYLTAAGAAYTLTLGEWAAARPAATRHSPAPQSL